MIRATTRYTDNKLRLYYSKFTGRYDQSKPVKVTRNQAGSVIICGEYINESPECDGGELCGGKAAHVITIFQYREVSFDSDRMNNTFNGIRNFMLLCPECLELYKSIDVMIGEPIDLIGFIRESKGA